MSVSGNELEILREWTGWFCHKLPERSPQNVGEVFPVCFRCAGVQLGVAASYVGLFVSHGWDRRFPAVNVVLRCAVLMLPLMIDGLGNALQLWSSPGWLRGFTGLGVGLSLPWLLAPLAQSLERATDPARKPSLDGLRQLLWPALAGGGAIVLLDRGCGPGLFRVLAVVAAAGWVLFLGHFVLALIRAYGGFITQRLLQLFPRNEVEA